MSKTTHPLMDHLRQKGETLSGFSRRVELSRMQLYRIMAGEGTTRSTIEKIIAATDGGVPASAFIKEHARENAA
ncbi:MULTISPECIES: hypothetical protein [unclassified Sinorhizobium]|uniref:hypothetical protein n=1 Tax=unclassified Sinorhizobium TaxID=2613772 RepID=UPI00352524E9